MSDVLSDEQLDFMRESTDGSRLYGRRVERATIAALAARGGVDVAEIAERVYRISKDYYAVQAGELIADAIRLAIATAEARHAEREAMWLELRELERGYWLAIERSPLKAITSRDGRIDELRRALGLEG